MKAKFVPKGTGGNYIGTGKLQTRQVQPRQNRTNKYAANASPTGTALRNALKT